MKKIWMTIILITLFTGCRSVTPTTQEPVSTETITVPQTATESITDPIVPSLIDPIVLPTTPPMIRYEIKDDLYTYGAIDFEGKEVLPFIYDNLDYMDGTDYMVGSIGLDKYLISLSDLSVQGPYDELDYPKMAAKILYNEDIYTYYDMDAEAYGYASSEGPLTYPVYEEAASFIDGYGVASIMEDGQLHYEVLNNSFEIVLENDLRIYNYGSGYFGLVKDFEMYLEYYNKVQLVNAKGDPLVDQLLFEVDVIDKDRIIVADHLHYWAINSKGDSIDSDPIISNLASVIKKIRVIDNNLLLYNDSYSQIVTRVLTTEGNRIYSNEDPTPSGLDALGGPYYIEQDQLVDTKFTNIVIPQLVSSEKEGLFDGFNELLQQNYSYTDPALSAEDVYEEYELSYTYSRIGQIVELNLLTYWYGFGAAHPNHGSTTYHVDLSTGKPYQLNDLSTNPDFYAQMTTLVQEMAAPEEEYYFDVDAIVVDETTQYYITNKGIDIYYSPYEIASYAAGYPSFHFNFEDLDGLIDTKTPFYIQLFQSANN